MKEIFKTWSEKRPRTREEWVHFAKIAAEAIILFGIMGTALWLSCALSNPQ